MNEREETEEIKRFPPLPLPCKESRPCSTVTQYQLDAPVMWDTRQFAWPNHSLGLTNFKLQE